jgi:flagellar biosynthesis protein FlhG
MTDPAGPNGPESPPNPEPESPADLPIEIFRDPGDDRVEVRRRPARILAVAGAKGGVGKTLLSTNFAIYLATIGRRVVLVDAEIEGTNAHTLLGLDDVVPGKDPSDIVETPVPGLRLLDAGVDRPPPGALRRTSRPRLMERLRGLEADYVVVDLGSGTDRTLLDFWLDSDLHVFVTSPDPAALENTYRFIRAAFARRLRRTAEGNTRYGMIRWLRAMGNTPPPLDLARRLEAAGDDLSDLVRAEMSGFVFRLALNQARARSDLELGDAMRSAVRRRFGVRIGYLGYVDHDDHVSTCVRARRPLLVESPGTKAAKSIEKIARRLLAIEAGTGPRETVLDVPAESHHDLLEVERGATDEEVRRAYKRAKDIYTHETLSCYGLFDKRSMDALRARLDEAHDVLLDPARRRPYELSVFPPSERERAPAEPSDDDGTRPPAPVLTPDTEYTGSLLRAVRESQGIDVGEIVSRTKIGSAYIRAIEEDDYASLPAPVYVRGFVAEVAKFLHLDSAQVSRTYLRRYQRYIDDRNRSA